MTEKIAIIHTGFHKTGSSSVQHTLAHNRKLLEKNRFHYPDVCVKGVRFYNRSVSLFGYYCSNPENFLHYGYHNDLDHELVNQSISDLFESKLWEKEQLIFSDEFVSTLSKSELETLRDDFCRHGFQLRIISYIRDPFNLIVSVAQQQTRRKTLESTFSADRPQKEVEKIKKLIEVFGNSAEFYSFEKSCLHSAGPAGFFFGLLGLSLDVNEALIVNEGMSDQAVRLLSYINGASPVKTSKHDFFSIRKKRDVELISRLKGDKFQLTQDELERIKPKVISSRKSISAILGQDFLPEVDFKFGSDAYWGDEQFNYLLNISNKLDLQVLIRVYDFLYHLDINSKVYFSTIDNISKSIRKRLDREILLNSRNFDLRTFLRRVRLLEFFKNAKGVIK